MALSFFQFLQNFGDEFRSQSTPGVKPCTDAAPAHARPLNRFAATIESVILT
jgi:hypothetical protein